MEPLAIVTRNNYVESIHHGIICVSDAAGKILYHIGDPHTAIFFRSAAKPFQAIPLITSGAADFFQISHQEIAIACASHSGREEHQDTVRALLERIGLSEQTLHCGIMWPIDQEERHRISAGNKRPTELHCSCSGKHTAMLALAKYRNLPLDTYEQINHPVQQEILSTIAQFSGENINAIGLGVDGCGAPIHLLPISKIALSYARLSAYAWDTGSALHRPCKTVWDAMTEYPEMVAGHDRFCTQLIRATHGRIIAKIGSEGVYCLAIKEGNIGVCIKIGDGNERATSPVIVEILKELSLIGSQELSQLEQWHKPILKNNNGQPIGQLLPVFSLKGECKKQFQLGQSIQQNK